MAALAAVALLNSCTKVIDINLNEADPKIVIEAELISGTHDFTVKITKTTDFFNPGQPVTVADAAKGPAWVKMMLCTAVLPLASVTVTMYRPGVKPAMAAVV